MKTRSWYVAVATLVLTAACDSTNNLYDASGTFEATEVIVSAENTGKLIAFDLTEGMQVEQGQMVGAIDSVQLYLKKLQLLSGSQGVLSKQSDVRKQLAATQELIVKQEKEKSRYEALVATHAATQKQLDDIVSQLNVYKRQLEAQRSTLERGNRGVNDEYDANILQVEQVEDQLSKCRILLPTTGTILAKYAEPGEFVTQGKPLFKVADLQQMFLRAYVTSDQLMEVKVGQSVTVIADYGADHTKPYLGTITRISDKSEFTPKGILTKNERANLVYAVKIAVANDGYLKIGMYGQVQLSEP